MLIINADDFGLNEKCTDRTIAAYNRQLITSCTAMVFMQDTVRAAELASCAGIGTGLHLNFTSRFGRPPGDRELEDHHRKLIKFFVSWRYLRYLYIPAIHKSIRYCFRAQYDEFLRVFKKQPTHIDGHHHIHLASNLVFGAILPRGTKIRRMRGPVGKTHPVNSILRDYFNLYLRTRYLIADFFYYVDDLMNDTSLARRVLSSMDVSSEIGVHPGDDRDWLTISSRRYLEMISLCPKGSYLDLGSRYNATGDPGTPYCESPTSQQSHPVAGGRGTIPLKSSFRCAPANAKPALVSYRAEDTFSPPGATAALVDFDLLCNFGRLLSKNDWSPELPAPALQKRKTGLSAPVRDCLFQPLRMKGRA